jgi:hypothetical protein
MTGADWSNAANLQDALTSSVSGDEIWVAAGNYIPHQTDQTISFWLPAGVELFGGFSGAESLVAERDWVKNLTVLDGDIGTLRNRP